MRVKIVARIMRGLLACADQMCIFRRLMRGTPFFAGVRRVYRGALVGKACHKRMPDAATRRLPTRSNKVPLYESVYIARPDISATQVEALTADWTKILEDNGGKVTKDEYWGLKSLAYRIKKNRKGHYSLMNIDAPPAALAEMERNMRLNEDVLRYMSIRVDEHEKGPSVMMQNKSNRDDRDRSRGPDGDSPREQRAEAADANSEVTAAETPSTEDKEPEE